MSRRDHRSGYKLVDALTQWHAHKVFDASQEIVLYNDDLRAFTTRSLHKQYDNATGRLAKI